MAEGYFSRHQPLCINLNNSQRNPENNQSNNMSKQDNPTGFSKAGVGGHAARSMMYLEMRMLVHAMPISVTLNDFVKAIVEENILEKPTLSSRKKGLRHLFELYGMDSTKALFRVFWDLAHSDSDSLPQLCLICAYARDPQLRHSFELVRSLRIGEVLERSAMEQHLENGFSNRFSPATKKSMAQNVNTSWTFAGHLAGRNSKDYLENHAFVSEGLHTGDYPRFGRFFWELSIIEGGWEAQEAAAERGAYCGGKEFVLFWEKGNGELIEFVQERLSNEVVTAWIKGEDVWGKIGVAISSMGDLRSTLYTGCLFTHGAFVVAPRQSENLDAIWTFCESGQLTKEARRLDQKVCVARKSIAFVPFDLVHWQKVAEEKYPNGLPKPHSDDPTQWLFNGHPKGSTLPLHVAVARLLGYLWPRQTGSSFPDCPALDPDGLESFADEDGIVCLPPLTREQPAAVRLRQLLTAALGALDERAIIAASGLKGGKSTTLEDWLRDEFFEQHAKLFHDRPFIWHLWDGRPDGFHALVNYHKLDHSTLQKLTYSYLGNWIQQQSDDAKADKPGAAERLGAARALQIKLAAILEGEAPLDIFVRWKPLKEQAQGWRPDINDGIRQNIRPFLMAGDVGKRGAGLFRSIPLKLKDKDRGTEPHRPKADYPWFWCEEAPGADPTGGKDFVGNRWNGVHLTLARKKRQAHEHLLSIRKSVISEFVTD